MKSVLEEEQNKSIHTEPDRASTYIRRNDEWAEVESVLIELKDGLKQLAQEKKNVFTLEYATISGAGKSRFVIHEFGTRESFLGIPMSFVALNFNGGTGAGSDTPLIKNAIIAEESQIDRAMSRLLLSRGLLSIHPSLTILNGNTTLPDRLLPKAESVIEALFKDRFQKSGGEGLLVVHLDELGQLKDQLQKLKGIKAKNISNERVASIKSDVDQRVKEFVSVLLDYTYKYHKERGQYILPVVSYTCPDNELLTNPNRIQTLFSPVLLHLFPFTLSQSVDLLKAKREERRDLDKNGKRSATHLKDIKWDKWHGVIALAGGHASLLSNAFSLLVNPTVAVHFNPNTVATVVTGLMTARRVQKFRQTINCLQPDEMKSFLNDCLLRREVKGEEHLSVLQGGVGWFQPLAKDGNTGLVSAPFPIIVQLMQACNDNKYTEIGAALNPTGPGFTASKAMEFVSALAVLLERTKSVDLWQTFNSDDAFAIVERETDDFFTVWPVKNQATLDFGGRLDAWKILGQTKMQEPGADTTERLADVLDLAWKIGSKVSAGTLTGKVHAYWVSSRKAQSLARLRRLIVACRVAMTGARSKEDAKATIEAEIKVNAQAAIKAGGGKKDKGKEVDVYMYIDLLVRDHEQNPSIVSDYLFSYIGRGCHEEPSIVSLEERLPKGIFAGWSE